MRYICTNCNYIYDESVGDSVDHIEGGILFEELDDFVCPVCEAPKDDFFPITEQVNYLEDGYLDAIEQEHDIDIYIEDDLLEVSLRHSNITEHRITEISIYDDVGGLIEQRFVSIKDELEFNFDISFLDEFEVRIRCNIHGVWGKKITR